MQQIWAEKLPEDCPPEAAFSVEDSPFFRLVSDPIAEEDFHSHQKLYPTKFFRVSECTARSLSIWDNRKDAEMLLGLPTLKTKKVCEIRLTAKDGVILQTGKKQSHFSWWKTLNFNFSIWEL